MQPLLRNAVPLSLLAVLLVLDPSRPAAAEVRTIQIDSATNRRQTTFAVYLPPHYAKDERTRYPVVYSLHGLSGDPTRRTGQIVPALEAALSTGAVAPMIWVFPDGQRNSFYGDAHDGHKQVYSNIVAEVIPYVDRQFRTRPDRASRAIEGFSDDRPRHSLEAPQKWQNRQGGPARDRRRRRGTSLLLGRRYDAKFPVKDGADLLIEAEIKRWIWKNAGGSHNCQLPDS